MPVINPFTGMPGTSSERIAYNRTLGGNGYYDHLPGGLVIDGTKTRDPFNTDDVTRLQAGLVLGKVTASGKLANSVIGVTTGALAQAGTSITVAARQAVELVRRVGAAGTFKLTGPPSASGVVRSLQATYSAVNQSTGAITITALGIPAVWTLTHTAGTDGGTYRLKVTNGAGVSAISDALAWNADTATVDAALEALASVGVAGVAAVFAVDTLTLTFAAALGDVQVEVVNDLTADGGVYEGGWAVVHTTTGINGAFVAGSFVQPEDGSETPSTFTPPGWEIPLPSDFTDLPLPHVPVGGMFDASQLLPYPADASLRTWLRNHLNTFGKFIFQEGYGL